MCICENIDAESQKIKIFNEKRRWGKIVTVVRFEGKIDVDLDELATKAKKKCASGGTSNKNSIEVQGDHRLKLKKFLLDQGFSEDNIVISS